MNDCYFKFEKSNFLREIRKVFIQHIKAIIGTAKNEEATDAITTLENINKAIDKFLKAISSDINVNGSLVESIVELKEPYVREAKSQMAADIFNIVNSGEDDAVVRVSEYISNIKDRNISGLMDETFNNRTNGDSSNGIYDEIKHDKQKVLIRETNLKRSQSNDTLAYEYSCGGSSSCC